MLGKIRLNSEVNLKQVQSKNLNYSKNLKKLWLKFWRNFGTFGKCLET